MSDLPALNFPEATLKLRMREGKGEVFDVVRKNWVALTPEEWVRQHLLHYLIQFKDYPLSLIAVEKKIRVVGRPKRFDVVVYNARVVPTLLVECKAANIVLGQDVVDQAGRYNITLNVPWLCVTNGLVHYCCKRENGSWTFKDQIPPFVEL